MKTRGTAWIAGVVGCALLACAPVARAETFSSVIVYGDSLSDNGNLYNATLGAIPAAPYYDGRFSNGPVAVEQLSGLLGAPLLDFAWGGATTGVGNGGDGGSQTSFGSLGLPGMLTELAGSASHVPSSLIASSLFVVWGGANDYEANGSPLIAAADIDAIVTALKAEGATDILVPGLPNLALTPEFSGSSAATQYSLTFNQALQTTLPAGATYFDTYALLNSIVADPLAYGFTNVTGSCYDGNYLTPILDPFVTPCSNPSQYLFWDDLHPTTAADAILAEAFDQAVAPTPEPGSIVLLGTGLVGVAGLMRRRWSAGRA